MTRLYSNDAVPENFTEYDAHVLTNDGIFNRNKSAQARLADQIISDYAGEKTVLLRKGNFDVDLELSRFISFPRSRGRRSRALPRRIE